MACTLSNCIIATDYKEPKPEKVLPLLLQVLKDPDPRQRQTAAQSLGKIGRKEAVPALTEALGDSDPGARQQAAWALGMIGDDSETTRVALITLLSDPNPNVRETAAWALGQTGDAPTGLPVLQDRLSQAGVTGDTKRLAAAALSGMEVRSSFGLVQELSQDRDPLVRRWAAAALAEIGGAKAVPPLSKLLKNDPDHHVRLEAAFRLGKIGDHAAMKALTAALKDSDENVRRIAEAALKETAKVS
jgi:HEAT repeat protein